MAEKKIIDVEVRETGLDELNDGLRQTETQVKKTGKSVDDVVGNGGAIAVLDQMTGGLATQFKNLYESTRLFNVSLKGTRTALLATGIGAFVVAAGLLVAYWDDIVDFIDGANKKLETQLTLIKEKRDILESQIKTLDAEDKLLKAQGKSTDELIEKKRTLLQAQIGILGAEMATLEAQRMQAQERAARDAGRSAALSFGTGGLLGGGEMDMSGVLEIDKQIEALKQNIYAAQTALIDLTNGEQTPTEDNKAAKGGKPEKEKKDAITGNPLSELAEQTATGTSILEDAVMQRNGIFRRHETYQTKIAKAGSDSRIQIAEAEKQARIMALAQSAEALMAFGDVVGQQTGAGKALASAGALINTWLGISNVWAEKSETGLVGAGLIQRIAATAVVAANGFAAIRNINKVQVPNGTISSSYFGGSSSGGGGGGRAAYGGGGQAFTPDFSIVGQSGINQLSEVIAERERQPVRAYVVSEEVRTQGELDRRIERTASIG